MRYKDICLILYTKLGLTLIGLEVKVGNQVKVFVNPSEYVLGESDYWGYAIYHKLPDFIVVNDIDLQKESAENFFMIDSLHKQDVTSN